MFHGKPWHFIAFFALMPPLVILSTKWGFGSNGVFVAILVTTGIVVLGAWSLKRLRRLFPTKGEAFAFLMGGPAVPMMLTPSSEEQAQVAPLTQAIVPSSRAQQHSEEYLEAEVVYEEVLSPSSGSRMAVLTPPHLRPENRYRLCLGSHTLELPDVCQHTLILEQLLAGSNGLVRLLAEEFGRLGVPFLLIDVGEGFSTLLPDLPHGCLLGSSAKVPALPARRSDRFIPLLDREQAERMGQTILQEGLQVIFRFGSYEAPSEAAQVLLAILEGMRTWEKRQMQAGRGPHPCLVIINEASRFFPDEIGHSIISDDLAMATRLMRHFLSCLQAQGEYGIFFSLVTRKVTGMHEGALSQCSLWLLKHVRASEVQTLCALIHLDPEALSVLQQQVLLIDIIGGQAFAITPRPTSSIQEEDDAPLSHVFTPSLTAPLPRGTTASPSESWRERDDEEHTSVRPWSEAEIAYACYLYSQGHLTPTALRRPPTQFLSAASVAGLNADPDKELMNRQRAMRLREAVLAMATNERAPYARRIRDNLASLETCSATKGSAPGPPKAGAGGWSLPHIGLLHQPPAAKPLSAGEKAELTEAVKRVLFQHRFQAEVFAQDVHEAARTIRIAVRPTADTQGRHVRAEQIKKLRPDLMMALRVKTIRIETPVPGTDFIGIEIPHPRPVQVTLRQLLQTAAYQQAARTAKLTVALGLDVAGRVQVADISHWPHILIAGTTGSGKSVMIHSIIACLLMQASPDDVRLWMIDPKQVELPPYNGIPHLLEPVVVDPQEAVALLQRVCNEMESRYRQLSQVGVRNLAAYREERVRRRHAGDDTLPNLPSIVVIIEELANLMMTAPEEVEQLICKVAQLSRATGIHLVIATQRPSVNVVTGLIKANIPCRIACMVPSHHDSQTIIDMPGAEQLLGRGDMLYIGPESGLPERMQGAFLSEEEQKRLADHWRTVATRKGVSPTVLTSASLSIEEGKQEVQSEPVAEPVVPAHPKRASGQPLRDGKLSPSDLPLYVEQFLRGDPPLPFPLSDLKDNEQFYRFVAAWTQQQKEISTSQIQQVFGIGYARASGFMGRLEKAGLVGPDLGAGRRRQVLVKQECISLSPEKEEASC